MEIAPRQGINKLPAVRQMASQNFWEKDLAVGRKDEGLLARKDFCGINRKH